MISMLEVINQFDAQFQQRYAKRLLPGHKRALSAMQRCRTDRSLQMLATCHECDHHTRIAHSCGHRLCPHCQQHESQQWLERQQQRRVPCEYFLVTFTVPRELRWIAFSHQRVFYDALMSCAWQTIDSFMRNDKALKGRGGAIAVLHTHSRRLDYHPHVHLVIPAGAIGVKDRRWRVRAKAGYLFPEKALARVFRAKLRDRLRADGLKIEIDMAKPWVVDCQPVGHGNYAITYLGKYLYRGVVREKDIVSMDQNNVTYAYTDNRGQRQTRCLKGEDFLWQVIQHTLPKGFRRVRNYGFLHPNSQQLVRIVQCLLLREGLLGPVRRSERPAIRCANCGSARVVVVAGLRMNEMRQNTEPLKQEAEPVM